MPPPLKAGQEVDSYCTKCKMDLTHRIVAVFNNKPVNVECRTCKQVHKYRAPKSAVAAPSASKPASSSASSPRAAAVRKAAHHEEPMAMVPPSHAHVHIYRMTERFTKGQWIQHKVFGIGLVTAEIGGDKIEVRFDAGPKVLVHGHTG